MNELEVYSYGMTGRRLYFEQEGFKECIKDAINKGCGNFILEFGKIKTRVVIKEVGSNLRLSDWVVDFDFIIFHKGILYKLYDEKKYKIDVEPFNYIIMSKNNGFIDFNFCYEREMEVIMVANLVDFATIEDFITQENFFNNVLNSVFEKDLDNIRVQIAKYIRNVNVEQLSVLDCRKNIIGDWL